MTYDHDIYYARWVAVTFMAALTVAGGLLALEHNWLMAICCALWAGVCALSRWNMRLHQHTRDAVRAMNQQVAEFIAEGRKPKL